MTVPANNAHANALNELQKLKTDYEVVSKEVKISEYYHSQEQHARRMQQWNCGC